MAVCFKDAAKASNPMENEMEPDRDKTPTHKLQCVWGDYSPHCGMRCVRHCAYMYLSFLLRNNEDS